MPEAVRRCLAEAGAGAVDVIGFHGQTILHQPAKGISVQIGDGALLATPAGSTAYNYSAHGPILPIGSDVLALTSVAAFRPRRWRGALLPETAAVTFEVSDPAVRSVSATADFTEVRDVVRVTISQDTGNAVTLLFDPEHDLEERIIKEQFLP